MAAEPCGPVAYVRTCNTCGAAYPETAWCRLRLLGIQHCAPGDPDLELRLCAVCTSTLARELPTAPATIPGDVEDCDG